MPQNNLPSQSSSNANDDGDKYRSHVEVTKVATDSGRDTVKTIVAYNESQHKYRLQFDVRNKRLSVVDDTGAPSSEGAPLDLHLHLVNEVVAATKVHSL